MSKKQTDTPKKATETASDVYHRTLHFDIMDFLIKYKELIVEVWVPVSPKDLTLDFACGGKSSKEIEEIRRDFMTDKAALNKKVSAFYRAYCGEIKWVRVRGWKDFPLGVTFSFRD